MSGRVFTFIEIDEVRERLLSTPRWRLTEYVTHVVMSVLRAHISDGGEEMHAIRAIVRDAPRLRDVNPDVFSVQRGALRAAIVVGVSYDSSALVELEISVSS